MCTVRQVPARSRSASFWVALIAILLTGCVASTQLVQNEKPSAEIKDKSFKSYREVLFIPPNEDRRNVVPRVVSAIEAIGYKVRLMDPDQPIEAAQGSAFLISPDGHVLTCAHVLGEERSATLVINGKRQFADVIRSDNDLDLALLKARDALPEGSAALSFRSISKGYNMGEDVFTIGYPLSSLLGSNARMSKGLVSGTTGLRDDPKRLQVSAEIQPGNSGGPLLDRNGLVIGVVQQTINPWAVAQQTGGALPQNVNFSIKSDPVLSFIKSANENVHGALRFDHSDGLEQANRGVIKVLAGIVPDDLNRREKMIVILDYISIWDMWYRFRLFVLRAYDLETREALFAVGQGRDNLVSNEDVVIKSTMEQFRKAVESR